MNSTRLADSLNAMLEQIEHLLAGMKQVSDNIAHDLRSPLSRMRNRLEATLMPSKPDLDSVQANRTRRGMRPIGSRFRRPSSEADQLLSTFAALAEYRAGGKRRAARQFSAGRTGRGPARRRAELYEPLAEEKRSSAPTGERCDPATVVGDRHLLFQASGQPGRQRNQVFVSEG